MAKRSKSPEEKIAELERKKAQLQARIDAENARAKTAARKLETRQKVIIGGFVLAHCKVDDEFNGMIWNLLDQHVARDYDRKALGLETRTSPARSVESVKDDFEEGNAHAPIADHSPRH